MAKNIGPCLEFNIHKDGAKIYFDFLPGTTSKTIFFEVKDALVEVFRNVYGPNNDFIKPIQLEDGTKSISIFHTKLQGVLKAILETRKYNNLSLKIKINVEDKNGHEVSKIITYPLEVIQAADVIPYVNKANNDMTTRRK